MFVSNSNALRKDEFRYGKNGNFLLAIAKITEEMYIESIQRNSNVRFCKSIIKSEHKIHKTDREHKDAMVRTAQGSSVPFDVFFYFSMR